MWKRENKNPLIFEIKFQEVIHPVGPDGRALPLLEDEES